jgi:argininosuccinate lyase
MLRDVSSLDEAAAIAVLTALDGVRRGAAPVGGPTSLVVGFDERLDALTSTRAPGAGRLGRGRADTAAAAARVVLRSALLDLLAATDTLRMALLELADAHIFTLLPAYGEGRPLQPTTLAHYLGGAIGPLGRAAARLRTGIAETNRSPLGAVALASTGVSIDREATARMLGFDGPVVSTFDAVSAVDHLSAALDPAAALASGVGRLLGDLQTWLRAEPASTRLAPRWIAPADDSLPQFLPAAGLDRLETEAVAVGLDAATSVRLATGIPYGPVGGAMDLPFGRALAVLDATRDLMVETAALVSEGLEINRAHFASRAGRDHVTSGELAALLIEGEGLDPAAARAVAAAVVRQAMDQGLEASGITPEAIDAAALATIGRELGIEIERLGAYLAPRRFLERRTALGAPSPAATRDWLELERTRTLADERWIDGLTTRIGEARSGLEREVASLLAEP